MTSYEYEVPIMTYVSSPILTMMVHQIGYDLSYKIYDSVLCFGTEVIPFILLKAITISEEKIRKIQD
jgi:hypothetical protein